MQEVHFTQNYMFLKYFQKAYEKAYENISKNRIKTPPFSENIHLVKIPYIIRRGSRMFLRFLGPQTNL